MRPEDPSGLAGSTGGTAMEQMWRKLSTIVAAGLVMGGGLLAAPAAHAQSGNGWTGRGPEHRLEAAGQPAQPAQGADKGTASASPFVQRQQPLVADQAEYAAGKAAANDAANRAANG